MNTNVRAQDLSDGSVPRIGQVTPSCVNTRQSAVLEDMDWLVDGE